MGSGVIFNQLERFRTTLADCDEFQKWTGNPGSSALAKSRIHIGELPRPAGAKYTREELSRIRPFCLVTMNQNGGFSSRRVGSPSTWAHAGSVFAHFEQDTPDRNADNHSTLTEEVLTSYGLILARTDGQASTINGLENLFGLNGSDYLAAEDVEFFGPFFSDPKVHAGQGDFIYALLEIGWGTR